MDKSQHKHNNTIVFYTTNIGKVNEVQKEFIKLKLDYNIKILDVDIPEIQSISVKEVIEHKLEYIKQKMSPHELATQSFIVEDTGLSIDNMNGFPGALIKFYLNSINTSGISKFNGCSKACAETWIGFWDSKTQTNNYFIGNVSGIISTEPRGHNGFGYDPIFIPDNINEYEIQTSNDENVIYQNNKYLLTFAEFNDAQKAMCNQRTIATYNLVNYLNVTTLYN